MYASAPIQSLRRLSGGRHGFVTSRKRCSFPSPNASADQVPAHQVADALNSLAATDALDHAASSVASVYTYLIGDGTTHMDEEQILALSDALNTFDAASASASHASPDLANGVQTVSSAVVSAQSHAYDTPPTAVHIFSQLGSLVDTKLATLRPLDPTSVQSLSESMTNIVDAMSAALNAEAADAVSHSMPAIAKYIHSIQQMLTDPTSTPMSVYAMQNFSVPFAKGTQEQVGLDSIMQITAVVTAIILVSVPRADAASSLDTPQQPPTVYDPVELKAYFATRPTAVLQRQAEVASKLASFVVAVLADWRLGAWERNMPARASWLRSIFESLGPAYIKIAQALSTRVDLLPETYLEQFARLQDNVPPFPCTEARALIEEELGQSIDQVFVAFSTHPVASASLGQVYQATLRPEFGGGCVAVKVQRPGVMEHVALDTLLMRGATEIVSAVPYFSDGWCEVLDDWASRFFQEMDYQREAVNMVRFTETMESMPAIVIPDVHLELTTRRVIVTQWIEGVKLSDCDSADVLELCDALLNCYLYQLLDTGFLHADPHPGNLLRTPDGRLCILDFGLVSEVDPDKRIHLVEYIANLTMEDWEGLTADLVALDFLPPNMTEEELQLITPVMKEVMGKLVTGGTAGVSMGSLSLQLEGVARRYKMVVPPYFALVLRAFSVIEGIAMQHNGNYRIVGSCMPYLAQRLLGDGHPRMQAALKRMLCGRGERLEVERLRRMLEALSSFRTGPRDAAVVQRPRQTAAAELWGSAVVDDGVKQVLKSVFSKRGTLMQVMLVDEMIAAINALTREALGEALRVVLASNAAVLALRNMEALGPLRAVLMPAPLPVFLRSRSVQLTAEDRAALDTLSLLLDMVGGRPVAPLGEGSRVPAPDVGKTLRAGTTLMRGAGELAPLVPELLPGVQYTVELFASRLVRMMAMKVADELDPTLRDEMDLRL